MTQASALRARSARPVLFRTMELEEVRSTIEQNFYSLTVDRLQPATEINGSIAVTSLGGVTVGAFSFGADLLMRFGELPAYHVDVPLSGTLDWHQGRHDPLRATADRAAVFQPSRDTTLDRWSGDCRLLAVKIERVTLEAQLEQLLDVPVRTPLELAPTMDISRGPGLTWLRLATLLAGDAHTPGGLAQQELVAGRLHDALVTGLLLAADHPYRETLARPVPPCRPAPVKRAVDAMEAHPERPYTASSLAAVSGVSVRRLQEGFRQHLGMSPMSYLRRVRLIRAHEELRWSEPGRVTVSDVAYRWGFTHRSRFAAAYRRRYGVPPSTTLLHAP
ncbi:AraC family transcriptional regulator [Streptomyces poonensis]|uniref:AraC family transcriptional regulator n=1 Tax=Streptomyces poonensis TaxID=68255 RepID=A0A918PNB5_9ACTN|nr:AraC family transcriptional regulator [Streptomyces poonensis]GGZ15609.1 AraC family transcriptional regulator [Streptomyces poonensis]GLJ91531.1 AraC family transcriptional regulator [Streptomyces poonensis]